MKKDGDLFVLDKPRWEEFQKKSFYRGAYEAEPVAEADTMLPLMQFKQLTKEEN
jgi:hypothetical protein